MTKISTSSYGPSVGKWIIFGCAVSLLVSAARGKKKTQVRAGIKLLPYRKWNSTEYACPSAATDTVEQQIFVEHYLGYYKGVPVAFCNGRSSRTRALRESLRKRQGLVKTRPLFYIVLRYSASNEHPRRGKGQLEKLRTKHLLFN